MARFRLAVLLASVLTLMGAARVRAQQADVIRGRITGPDNQPLDNVTVTVTSISNNTNKTAKTDRQGRFTIVFPSADGDYYVSIAALGYVAKHFEVKRVADEDILLADAKLEKVGAVLDAVKVQAARQKPSRTDNSLDIGGSEQRVNPMDVPLSALGDLASMASSLPGVTLIPGSDGNPDAFSVLGLSSDQNQQTLNGLPFGGANVPRDANVRSSLVTNPYDVSSGGFSGGQFRLMTGSGSNFISRTQSLQFDSPSLQLTDPAGRSLGQDYTRLSASGATSGPFSLDKAFYNVSYQFDHQLNPLQSLLNTDALGLQTVGISQAAVDTLLGLVQKPTFNIPTSFSRIPGSATSNRGNVFGSFDLTPPSSTSGQAFDLTFAGAWSQRTPTSSSMTSELPSHDGELTFWNGSVQGKHTNYFGFGVLSETNLGLSTSHNYTDPYLLAPSGNVRVLSTFPDGSTGVKNVAFGGNPALNTSGRTTVVSYQNALSWFSENNKHRIKLTSELRHETQSQDLTTNELGTFSYNSLNDVAAGIPASFTRALSPRLRSEGQYIGALSLGDSYRESNDLQIQYGVRLDANHYSTLPNANPAVAQTFGVSNTDVPNRIYPSARAGFAWTYGTAPQIGGFEGAVRGPKAVVRGGLGVWQNTPSTGLIGQMLDNTGLPSAASQLFCVGSAVPTPDWSGYIAGTDSVPATCANGSTGTVFSNSAPNVSLFDPNYAAQRRVGSNLQWNGATLGGRFMTTLDGTYALNLNQPGVFDINFQPGTAQFTLPDEAGRPVFVSPTSVVPTTGSVAILDSRTSKSFLHVSESRSDLRSETKQLTIRVSPLTYSGSFGWNLSYVYMLQRDRYNGFSSTDADPRAYAWGTSGAGRHQVTYSFNYNLFNTVTIQWYGRVQSGFAYTPMVAGDINGDGYANDRAFIFKPTPGMPAQDSVVAAGIQSLIANSGSAARNCLTSQLGLIATRNSCEGPWSNTATMGFQFNPLKVRLPQRASLSFQLGNPFGAVDYLLHGQNNLRGWGLTPIPDNQLLYVQGFDQTNRRFTYNVNQRFGATNLQLSQLHTPVTLTMALRVDVGPTRERQLLTQMLDRGRTEPGQKLNEATLKAYYGSGGVTNPMATMLRQADTLKLTNAQADSVASINRWYTTQLDSIWSPVAKYLANLPVVYNQSQAYDHYVAAREATVDLLIHVAPRVHGLLTEEQNRMLPSYIASFLDPRYLSLVRSGTAGAASGLDLSRMGAGGAQVIMISK